MEIRRIKISREKLKVLQDAITNLGEPRFEKSIKNIDDNNARQNGLFYKEDIRRITVLQKAISDVLDDYEKTFDLSNIDMSDALSQVGSVLVVQLDNEVESLLNKAFAAESEFTKHLF